MWYDFDVFKLSGNSYISLKFYGFYVRYEEMEKKEWEQEQLDFVCICWSYAKLYYLHPLKPVPFHIITVEYWKEQTANSFIITYLLFITLSATMKAKWFNKNWFKRLLLDLVWNIYIYLILYFLHLEGFNI